MRGTLGTPVLFLVFSRPDTTRRVLAEIRKVRPTQLFVAADGPRPDRPGEAERCRAVRDIMNEIDWDCELHTLYREENLGLKRAISSAISWFFDQVEEGIILEDDCLPVPSFFSFCEALLVRYRDDARVLHISGNNFQDGQLRGDSSYYFSKLPAIWGWATWRRAWALFDADMQSFPGFVEQQVIKNVLPHPKTRAFWMQKLEATRRGNDSWGFPWVYTVLSQSGLCINPNRNLVSNCGFMPGGAHAVDPESRLANIPAYDLPGDLVHPHFVVPNMEADEYFTAVVASEQSFPRSPVVRLKALARQILGDQLYETVKHRIKQPTS